MNYHLFFIFISKTYLIQIIKLNTMKKIFYYLIILMMVPITANGQFTKAGGGLGFTTGFPFHEQTWDANKSGKLNIVLKGIYEINGPLQISPSITWFIPHVTNESTMKTVVSTTMIDINGHYVFKSLDKFDFYGLAGINLLFAGKKETPSGSSPTKERDNAIGLNLGAGTYMRLSEKIDLFVEAKYVVSRYNQFMLNAGLLFNIGQNGEK
jgi:hypothetical protein